MPKFEHEVEVNAPAEVIWSILSNPTQWPQWFWATDSVSNVTAVQNGGTFSWVNGSDTGTGTIANVVPNEHLQLVTQWENNHASHSFDIKPDRGLFKGGGKFYFIYTMEYGSAGGFLGSFVSGGNPMDQKRVKDTTDQMKDLAERQAGNG